MGFKKTEIAANVFDIMDPVSIAPVGGGALQVPVTDLASLAMVPWFCDVSVQWALRVSDPSGPLKKNAIAKLPNTYVAAVDGRLLIGVPGDGIEPASYTLKPLADAIAVAVAPGSTLELATANLGRVKRDYDVKAETATAYGNQRYAGTVTAPGAWAIERSTPAVPAAQLDLALDCGRRFIALGPWDVKDKAEAEAILRIWMASLQANINPMAVQQLWTLRGLTFDNAGTDEQRRRMGGNLDRKLYGLALGYFRHRLQGGPFTWSEGDNPYSSAEQIEAAVRAVVQ